MNKLKVNLTVLFAILISSAFAQEPSVMISDKPGWHKIGEVKADFDVESESISVLGKDVFKSILLKATDAPISIQKVTVTYESGESEDVDINKELQPGTETRVMDLKRPSQEISKVTFTFKTLPNRKDEKAHVELYGLSNKTITACIFHKGFLERGVIPEHPF